MADARDFHVRREPRDRYAVRRPLIGVRGDLVVRDVAGIRRLADRMNRARAAGTPSIQTGEIAALGLLHEVGHLLIARYEADVQPGAMAAALAHLEARFGPDADHLLDRFGDEFPGAGPDPEPATYRLEELLLTRIANENPAIGPAARAGRRPDARAGRPATPRRSPTSKASSPPARASMARQDRSSS